MKRFRCCSEFLVRIWRSLTDGVRSGVPVSWPRTGVIEVIVGTLPESAVNRRGRFALVSFEEVGGGIRVPLLRRGEVKPGNGDSSRGLWGLRNRESSTRSP